MLLSKAIEMLEKEIERIEGLVVDLRECSLYRREAYRACEVKRFQRILNLLKAEAGSGKKNKDKR